MTEYKKNDIIFLVHERTIIKDINNRIEKFNKISKQTLNGVIKKQNGKKLT